MRNFWLNIPRSVGAVRALELSKEAKHRLCIIGWYENHGRNAALTRQRFGISRDTFYRWLRRFQRYGPGGLEEAAPDLTLFTGEEFADETRERILGNILPMLIVVLMVASSSA